MGVAVFYAFGVIFTTCEFGQLLCHVFGQIDNEIEAFDWYLFSYEMQQMQLMMLMTSQQPVELVCFGSLTSGRELFKKVNSNQINILQL